MSHVIETTEGRYFDYADATNPAQVDVRDIARSLSMQVRFGGFVSRFYSVAEHALYVAELVEDVADAELAYAALHHDSHEAYIGDMPSPLKTQVGPLYKDLALAIDSAVAQAFGFHENLLDHPFVKEADALALRIEAGKLKHSRGVGEHWGQTEIMPGGVWCLSQKRAEQRFLDRHFALRRDLGLM